MANPTNPVEAGASNIYSKLLEARARFLAADVKKKGVNQYAEFDYFRLEEIIPVKQEIFKDLGIADIMNFGSEAATLTLVNVDKPEEVIVFTSQLDRDESMIKNPIQKVGAIQTYVRRYLYQMALDIIESDTIDATAGKPGKDNVVELPTKPSKPATAEEREEIAEELIDQGGKASDTQIKSIKKGLSKLRDKEDNDYEDYITVTVKELKAGITKTRADEILKEIGKKVAE